MPPYTRYYNIIMVMLYELPVEKTLSNIYIR